MDTDAKVTIGRNEKGMVMVYVAVLLIMLFAFVALAVDMGYRHVAKSQLQTAADAAALAGAAYLPDYNLVRFYAMSTAHRNNAAGSPVKIENNGTNTLSDTNDITVGNFNRKLNPAYLPGGDPAGTPPRPINAVQVQVRRTQNTNDPELQSKVDLFFASLFGHPSIGVAATAIAQRKPRAGAYFMISRLTCNPGAIPAGGLALAPDNGNMAWTSLLVKSTSAGDGPAPGVVRALICKDYVPDVDVCNELLYTSNGVAADVFKDYEASFYDPEYDSKNKTIVDGVVSTWTLIVPVADVDDPSKQPDTVPVKGYARITLTRACGSGVGKACRDYSAPTGKASPCSGGENDIVISAIECVSCEESYKLLGAIPTLAD
ncbi:pilus assembly protein TadG-related protein [Geomonas sp. RF6]|uniref:pilus assembly protein TadG-related protein n=1 Tax=Geomonas sp. RF6 TaxID=2897342 RepID=UPI001E52D3C0|nr:pilus assembly protein TadG-related protein [Geomonas sp. RF6]UFS70011.1 pilus assembly protein TadG-related protein [Geomonas sp. RF6]